MKRSLTSYFHRGFYLILYSISSTYCLRLMIFTFLKVLLVFRTPFHLRFFNCLPYRWEKKKKKKKVKSDHFFNGDQYFSPTNNFTRLKLTPTKKFYQLFFALNNENQNLKRNYQIYYRLRKGS